MRFTRPNNPAAAPFAACAPSCTQPKAMGPISQHRCDKVDKGQRCLGGGWSPAGCVQTEAGDCFVQHTELAAPFTVGERAEAAPGTPSSSSSALSITAVGSTCNRKVLITKGHSKGWNFVQTLLVSSSHHLHCTQADSCCIALITSRIIATGGACGGE